MEQTLGRTGMEQTLELEPTLDSGQGLETDSGGSRAEAYSVPVGTGGLRTASIDMTGIVDCSGLTCVTVTGRAGSLKLDSMTLTGRAGCSGLASVTVTGRTDRGSVLLRTGLQGHDQSSRQLEILQDKCMRGL